VYGGADKSLARPGRKQPRKHVRDVRDFNNIETRAVIKFFWFPARQGAVVTSRHSDRNISFFSFLVALRTYQHPCILQRCSSPSSCTVRRLWSYIIQAYLRFNPLTPNDPYMSRTAPLTSKCCILYIYSTNVGTEYFKHALYSPSFSSKCSSFHITKFFRSCIIHILYTGCAKIKKNNSGAKGLIL